MSETIIDDVKTQKVACQNLRTKSYYIPALRHDKLLTEDGLTATYWCTSTLGPIGPDEMVACPSECCSKLRSCYE